MFGTSYQGGCGVMCTLSYSMIVLYSRDHIGVGMAHQKNITKKPASLFSGDDEAF